MGQKTSWILWTNLTTWSSPWTTKNALYSHSFNAMKYTVYLFMNRLDHYSETKCPTVSNMGSGFIVPRVQTVFRYSESGAHRPYIDSLLCWSHLQNSDFYCLNKVEANPKREWMQCQAPYLSNFAEYICPPAQLLQIWAPKRAMFFVINYQKWNHQWVNFWGHYDFAESGRVWPLYFPPQWGSGNTLLIPSSLSVPKINGRHIPSFSNTQSLKILTFHLIPANTAVILIPSGHIKWHGKIWCFQVDLKKHGAVIVRRAIMPLPRTEQNTNKNSTKSRLVLANLQTSNCLSSFGRNHRELDWTCRSPAVNNDIWKNEGLHENMEKMGI